jgi:hypothetical protein
VDPARKMTMIPTEIEMFDVTGKPSVRRDLPASLRVGDRIKLRFRLQQVKDGRNQELVVDGDFRAVQASLDATCVPPRQKVSVESASGVPPVWRSLKGPPSKPQPERVLSPTHFPPTTVR